MRTGRIAKVSFSIALALATFLAGCYVPFGDAFKAEAKRTEELTAPLDGITSLDVATNVGTLKLEAADVEQAHITAEITVKAKTEEEAQQLVEEVRITAEPSGQKLVVKAVKPDNFGRNQLSVNFTITAPNQLALACTTNVGDIEVAGFAERVEGHTDVGSITGTDLRGALALHTNVGDIKVAYAPDAPAAMNVDLSTNVGSIDFAGPQEISANLTAAANVGSIDTDRPLPVTGQIKKSIRASLGDCDGQIRLNTNVGSIKIR